MARQATCGNDDNIEEGCFVGQNKERNIQITETHL